MYPGRSRGASTFGHTLLATTALAKADLQEARKQAETVLLLTDPGSGSQVFFEAQGLALLALVVAASGDAALAERHAAAGVAAARQIPGSRSLVMALTRATEAAVISDRPEAAKPHLDELLGLVRELGSPG